MKERLNVGLYVQLILPMKEKEGPEGSFEEEVFVSHGLHTVIEVLIALSCPAILIWPAPLAIDGHDGEAD